MTQSTHRTRDIHVPAQREPADQPDRPVIPPDAGPQRSVVWGFRTPRPIAEQRAVQQRRPQTRPKHRRATWWSRLLGRD